MMRILYHHRTLADGAEGVHIDAMINAFRDLGHEVRVLGRPATSGSESPATLIARLRERLPREAFEAMSAAFNVAEYANACLQIRRHRPDFVYKRHARNDVATVSAARALGIPSVLEVNCVFSSEIYQRFEPLAFQSLTGRLERRALRSATIVTAVSTPLARQIRDVASIDAVVLPNGADPLRFTRDGADPRRVRRLHGLPPQPVVGWAGILRNWHGLDLLLEAAARTSDVTLLIVGDGPARADVERRASNLGLNGRVVFAGRVPHSAMPDYLAAMDVAVVADDQTRVASPMKLVEYMAMSLAVVAPRLENIGDLIGDGVEGVLFQPGDSAQLLTAVTRLVRDPALRARLGAAARARVERQLNWRASAEAIVDIIKEHRA